MVASKKEDIPDWERVTRCGCKGCAKARLEGKQDLLNELAEIVHKYGAAIEMRTIPISIFENFVERKRNE